MHYLYLAAAIVCEVAGTSALKQSDGMTRLGPSVVVVVGYVLAFFLLSLTLRSVPVGIAYAIWSGVGIVLISIVGAIWFKQTLDFAAFAGMLMIIGGVAVIYLFSATAGR
jgi:small multidrug resistance pump